MGKRTENLRWSPKWVSHLGCIKGCLEYLNIDVSAAWLHGATGHAFIINLHEEVCPSGPTAWHTEMLFKLGNNTGYAIDGVVGFRSDNDFAEKQKLAWENTKRAIDEGLPCYGWELGIPEFYVVYGYDDEGRYLVHPQFDRGEGPVPWQKLGDTEIGVLEMYTVKPGQAADDTTTVKEALGFAVEHSGSPAKWIYPRYGAGLAGFDNWVDALRDGKATSFGVAFNAAVWRECRGYAVEFLREAKQRIGGNVADLFDEAADHYESVAHSLERVKETFPFPPEGDEVEDADRCVSAADHLRDARSAEEAGLRVLARIGGEL